VSSGSGPVTGSALGTFSVNGLPSGVYTLQLVVTDRAGNLSKTTSTILVGVSVPTGDVNGDGKVNIVDATLALRAAVGLTTLTPAQFAAADLNGDGKITVVDPTRILRIAVGLG
jgi:hypothetical protein